MQNFEQESEQSSFNSALASLERIHEVKQWLGLLTIKEDLTEYYKYLKVFYKELYPMFTKEKKDQVKRWRVGKCFEPLFNNCNGNTRMRNKLRNWLEEWELELRVIDQEKGMNMPKKGDPRFAMARK